MRLNKWLVQAGAAFARRKADELIEEGRVKVNGRPAQLGQTITTEDEVSVDGEILAKWDMPPTLLSLHKPVGYVCSHRHQGDSPIIFDLLPKQYRNLTLIGRLDKDSEGLVLLTNDGQLANELTHPSREVSRVYEVTLNAPVDTELIKQLTTVGIELEDGVSVFDSILLIDESRLKITMHTGKNRQIRRTFAACDRKVRRLKRIQHDRWVLGDLKPSEWREEKI